MQLLRSRLGQRKHVHWPSSAESVSEQGKFVLIWTVPRQAGVGSGWQKGGKEVFLGEGLLAQGQAYGWTGPGRGVGPAWVTWARSYPSTLTQSV